MRIPQFARHDARVRNPNPVDIERPRSNFDFVEGRFPTLDTLRRLLSQVRRHGGRTMVVEENITGEDLLEENADLKRCGSLRSSNTTRLSFFRKRICSVQGLNAASEEQFLGYALIKVDEFQGQKIERIYESVLAISDRPNNYVRGSQKWETSVGGIPFTISGYLFAQQNNVTTSCAHVALRTAAARFHSDGDVTYRQINRSLGITPGIDDLGLNSNQMATFLESIGAKCFDANYFGKKPAIPFQKAIYGSIESGFPSVVLFGTDENPNSYHAIPVFGHTLNQDTWVPNAERSYFRFGEKTKYIPSESWVSMFIAHDDNWGSNLCIPRDYLQTKKHLSPDPRPKRKHEPSVAHVIPTFPGVVKRSATEAEVIAHGLLSSLVPQLPNIHENRWSIRLKQHMGLGQLVLRSILVKFSDYLCHLRAVRAWNWNPVCRRQIRRWEAANVRDFYVWLIELSVPELFSANFRKIGEIVLDAEADLAVVEHNPDLLICARLPGFFAFHTETHRVNRVWEYKYSFQPSGVDDHVELFECEELPKQKKKAGI
jgi:hypothetical protein